jgi:hypothetical protein
MAFSFQVSLEVAQSAQARALEFADPAIGNLLNGNGIEEV